MEAKHRTDITVNTYRLCLIVYDTGGRVKLLASKTATAVVTDMSALPHGDHVKC